MQIYSTFWKWKILCNISQKFSLSGQISRWGCDQNAGKCTTWTITPNVLSIYPFLCLLTNKLEDCSAFLETGTQGDNCNMSIYGQTLIHSNIPGINLYQANKNYWKGEGCLLFFFDIFRLRSSMSSSQHDQIWAKICLHHGITSPCPRNKPALSMDSLKYINPCRTDPWYSCIWINYLTCFNIWV